MRSDGTAADDPENIIVFRIGGIGDAVTTTPVLRALRNSYPKSHITLLVEETPAELMEESPWVDRIISDDNIYRCQKFADLLEPENLKRLYDLHARITSRRYDLFIELHRLIRWSLVLKPWLFAWMSGADRNVGLDTYGRGFFLTDRVEDDPERVRSQVKWFGDILDYLGLSYDTLKPEIVLSNKTIKKGNSLLAHPGNEGTVVGLFLGANPEFPHKYWPVNYFVDLTERLITEMDVDIIAFSGPAELERVERFNQRTRGRDDVRVLQSEYPIKTIAGFIKSLDYLVSADTGPMHMGVALDTPTLGIFGPSEWHWYGTYSSDFNFVRAGPVGSEDVEFKEPDQFETSMEEVTVDYVFDRFQNLVANSSSS